jgi:hypothetical protein
MTDRALDLARLIFEAEPDAAVGDPAAVERVTQALAKISGAILAATLVRNGENALAEAMQSLAKVMELEARRTASLVQALSDESGDPTGTIN